MSIIRKPYTISVWDDIWDSEKGKFVEKRLGIIGSDKMETQSRVIEPEFTRNTNGTKKLTFKLYKRYKDNITGETVENPFYDWLVNERKVKLNLDGEWHDFIVKNISENSSNYLYTYQLEDALTQELSKNGFNVELNDTLMNNSGTANELAGIVLEETDWKISDNSEAFVEVIEEALVWLTVKEEFKATQVFDQQKDNLKYGVGRNEEEVTIPVGTNILAFYSSCVNKPYRFQFIYVDGGLPNITKDANRLITNSDCQYCIDNLTYTKDAEDIYGFYLPSFLELTTVEEASNTSYVTVSGEYRAKRYGFSQKTLFVSPLNRYVGIYYGPQYDLKKPDENGNTTSNIYYGYLNTKYDSPILMQNFISNTQFKNDKGWTATKIGEGEMAGVENVAGRFSSSGSFINIIDELNSNLSTQEYSTYMKLTFNGGNSRVVNSGPYDNRYSIGNMETGEEWAVICEVASGAMPTFELGEYEYSSDTNGYEPINYSKISFNKTEDKNLPAGITALFTVSKNEYSKEVFKKNSKVCLIMKGSGTCYIKSINLFRVVRDDEGNILFPKDFANDINERVISKKYHFFKPEQLNAITNEDQLIPDKTLDYLDYLSYSTFIPAIDEQSQKIRTVSAKESNYFNILQSIAETFGAWLDFEITRDSETGAITGKKVKFRNYIGKENPIGFKYGINLKDIQRTFESKQIVTKLIVKDNKNEFATNGFCTIARAGANPTGENYIYDFQYFFNRGLLNARDYLDNLYAYNITDPSDKSKTIYAEGKDINNEHTKYNIIGYFPRIKVLNRKIDEANVILFSLSKDLTQLNADYQTASMGLESTIGNIEQCEIDFKKAIATNEDVSIKTHGKQYASRTDIQKILQEYSLFVIEKEKYAAEKSNIEIKLNGIVDENGNITVQGIQQKYDGLAEEIYEYKKSKIELNRLFFQLYSRFIQEGTWIDESYVDDEKYYADAQSTLYNSCYPKAAYTVNVIEISKLPGYEDFSYGLGDKTFIEDREFFGSAAKVEVVLTETTENLDDPTKNKLKIQTFKNQFQDLFQKITATVQQTQYSTGSYEKAVALAEASQERKNQFVTDALDAAEARLQVAGQQSVEIGDDGITITDVDTPSDKIRMVGGAILLSKQDKNGQTKWVTGVTSDGVSASLITAGVLNAGEISIMDYNQPLFRWDSFGLSAYFNDWSEPDGNIAPVISNVDTKKFIRFDKYGIYGINHSGVDGLNWYPKWNQDINGNWISPEQEIDNRSTFALTWQGLKVTGNDGVVARIGRLDGNIIKVTNGTNDTFVVDNNGNVTVRGDLQVGDGNSVEDFVSGEISKVDTSAQQYAAAAAATAEAVREDLQKQIDGEITSWFYEGEPTTENEPAKDWTTEEDKIRHEGDLYYNTTSGRAYRWIYNNTTDAHEWTIVTDEAIAKALAAAQDAQSTADGKMTVFSTQPKPPYQIGDLWVNATYGQYSNDLLRCKTSKNTGSFSIDDWELASKYTDDTKANEALNQANAANNKYITLSGDISNGEGIFEQGISKVVNKDYIDKFEIQAGSIIIYNKNTDGSQGSRIFSAEPVLKSNGTLTGGVYLAGWTVTDNQLSYCDSGTSLGQNGTFGIYPKGISSGLSDFSGSLASGDAWVITAGNDFGVTKKGALYANYGTIGGWTINSTGIYYACGTGSTGNIVWHGAGMILGGSSDTAFYAGESYDNRSNAPFRVTHNGSLYATKGNIAGWTIDSNSIIKGTLGSSTGFHMHSEGYTTTDASDDKKYFGQATDKTWKLGIGSNFGVTDEGILYAVGADLSGKISADDGDIGGWQITKSNIYNTAKYWGYGSGVNFVKMETDVVIGRRGLTNDKTYPYLFSIQEWTITGDGTRTFDNAPFYISEDAVIYIQNELSVANRFSIKPQGIVSNVGNFAIYPEGQKSYPTLTNFYTQSSTERILFEIGEKNITIEPTNTKTYYKEVPDNAERYDGAFIPVASRNTRVFTFKELGLDETLTYDKVEFSAYYCFTGIIPSYAKDYPVAPHSDNRFTINNTAKTVTYIFQQSGIINQGGDKYWRLTIAATSKDAQSKVTIPATAILSDGAISCNTLKAFGGVDALQHFKLWNNEEGNEYIEAKSLQIVFKTATDNVSVSKKGLYYYPNSGTLNPTMAFGYCSNTSGTISSSNITGLYISGVNNYISGTNLYLKTATGSQTQGININGSWGLTGIIWVRTGSTNGRYLEFQNGILVGVSIDGQAGWEKDQTNHKYIYDNWLGIKGGGTTSHGTLVGK